MRLAVVVEADEFGNALSGFLTGLEIRAMGVVCGRKGEKGYVAFWGKSGGQEALTAAEVGYMLREVGRNVGLSHAFSDTVLRLK